MKEELKKCLAVLRKGGTILYPTDTIWGIGCDATNEEAVQKVFAIKNRPSSKAMLILVADPSQLEFYAEVPDVAKDLVEYAEKPLTIIYPGAKHIAKSLIADDGTIAIRVVREMDEGLTPAHFCRQLINTLRKPIVSTSANISGEAPPASFNEISGQIKEQVDYIVPFDQHDKSSQAPSRIFKLGKHGEIEIIR